MSSNPSDRSEDSPIAFPSIPTGGLLAANILLDAVVAYDAQAPIHTNVTALTTALMAFSDDADAPSRDGRSVPETGDIVAAAVVCLTKLCADRARDEESSSEVVVAEMRTYLESFRTESREF
ncbi:macro domain-containing protein [Subtercola endophyticus]|uniref:hypothetical protein n=1 Tax=Subtercola endophyticus TaxID=2895559 RepID=UPI001E480DE4|nr:hypothetical protein [Subtercola endophyticus]UFS60826.1 hypothetical protein LQ955_08855 [Subtercola endophyticus]